MSVDEVVHDYLDQFYTMDFDAQESSTGTTKEIENFFEELGIKVPDEFGRICFSVGVLVGSKIAEKHLTK